jgi:ABC-type antimicrobial peptide transport system permease subunit
MLGIFIGIAAVVSLFSLGQGLKLAITGQFASLDVDKLTITSAETGFGPPGAFAVRKLNEHDVELIERVNGVKMAIPRLVRIAEVEYNKVSIYYYVGNIPEDPEEIKIIYDSLNVEPIQGRLLTKDDRGKVVLGYDFTGERFGKPIEVGKSINIHGQDFEVVGILDKASTFTINSVIIMPEEDMKRLLDMEMRLI